MAKKLAILIMALFTVSCDFFDPKNFRGDECNNTQPIEGIYENFYDKKAENLLILKSDGTFEQIFKKDSIIKKHNGTWKFFEKSCDIRLNNLVFLHELPKQYADMDIYSRPAIHRKDNIYFIDHYNLSFYRKED